MKSSEKERKHSRISIHEYMEWHVCVYIEVISIAKWIQLSTRKSKKLKSLVYFVGLFTFSFASPLYKFSSL